MTSQNTCSLLIIDDNPEDVTSFRRFLRNDPLYTYTFSFSENGEEGLQTCQQQRPDCILLDYSLPDMTGVEFLTHLDGLVELSQIAVIMLTGQGTEKVAVEAMKHGAHDYLNKGTTSSESLQHSIHHALDKASLQRELYARRLELEQKNHELELLYDETQKAIQDRNALLSMVSHDLKNPLGAIKGFVELMQRKIKRSQMQDVGWLENGLDKISIATSRMNSLLSELLDLALLQGGQPLELERLPVDLVELIQQRLAEQPQSTMIPQLHFETSQPQLIGEWDARRLERVLDNLISNAIKYSPAKGDVFIRLTKTNTEPIEAVLQIKDQGIGIPAEDLPYVFERFQRARNVVGKISGTGIGLASVRQIVEHHGGTVSVKSHEHQGTTFTVRLPLRKTQTGHTGFHTLQSSTTLLTELRPPTDL